MFSDIGLKQTVETQIRLLLGAWLLSFIIVKVSHFEISRGFSKKKFSSSKYLDFYCTDFTKIYVISQVIKKTSLCICKNKGVDQLRGNHAADQRLCFR